MSSIHIPDERSGVKSPTELFAVTCTTSTTAATAGVPVPPICEHAALCSLLVPARAASGHIGVCGVAFLGLQVCKEARGGIAGAGAAALA
jgi:hypothetical protein